MTLTVRLDDTLAAALDRYCTATGATKSLVVQESLARYLMASQSAPGEGSRGRAAQREAPSRNFRAFEAAGLIGCVALGREHGPEQSLERGADKAAVRARVAASFAQRRARQGGA
jgi:hypothetical protein